ncbi:Putative cell wall-binding protein [Kytococcus aerolatus]|uniref:Putative cell wall-binding protein n=1 Tax=Kytococcus aerolatus TaxID=592308 RepID=A0A212U555_9MICO|nr:cell wall-binding repeat-containing protein [Kytococcus aerolatus]SNC73326.1 Putative cell wall-binding protein [Kytococcus aerolatus]
MTVPSHLTRVGLASTMAIALAGSLLPATATGPAPDQEATDRSQRQSATVQQAQAKQAAASQDFTHGTYLVTFADQPAIAYDGHVEGYPATQPGQGAKLNASSSAVQRYAGLLHARQDRVLASVGAGKPSQRYTNALSGVAVDLTADQAKRLASSPRVLSVVKERIDQLDTHLSPDFLGLTGPDGVWNAGTGYQGEGMVVGVIDSGISWHNPSFSPEGMPAAPADWEGACAPATNDFPAEACNNKIVGARHFVDGFGADRIAEHESLSPLDVGGHGSHTASTAAGNRDVPAIAQDRELGQVSGVAPKAHVAAYKVCWDEKDGDGGCANTDSVAAIDQAVADGVDVLNYSISGTRENYLDPVEIAFMNASANGIFVAASSGNSGPAESTTAHPSPWLTTVAASTHAISEQTLVTGDGRRYIGASVTEDLPDGAPMILADQAVAAGRTVEEALLCLPGSLDAAKVAGKIVVCDRGENARTEKSDTVAEAGGVGMVLVNTSESSLDSDLHVIPTVHLSHTHRDAVRAYVEGAGPEATGTILDSNEGTTTEVPEIAGFSSRGPSLAGSGDVLKPDISAPGVGVLAASASPERGADVFEYMSGTSMSSPHIAGLAALVKQANPSWTPMAVKSALMTSARDHASAASNDPFATGAGFVEPRRMLNPGLVYDANQSDWFDFLAGQGATYSDGSPVSENPIDASDLNQASIAIGELLGDQTVTRTITNVSGRATTWEASFSGLEGVEATVSPSTVDLGPGESAEVEVTFTDVGLADGAWSKGHLIWSATGQSDVRSPIALRARDISAPAIVHESAAAPSVDIPITSSDDRSVDMEVKGLVPGEDVAASVGMPADNSDLIVDDPNNLRYDVTITEGEQLWSEIIPADTSTDLDLFVTPKGSDQLVGMSAAAGAEEQVLLPDLEPGEYTVHVQAWNLNGQASTDLTLRTFEVPDEDQGNLTFDDPVQLPRKTETDVTGAIGVDDVTRAWLGEAVVTENGQELDSTYVYLDPAEGGPVDPSLTRLWGSDRYGTAADVASEFGASDTVYIASGEGFADAMSGSAGAAAGVRSTKGLPSVNGEDLPLLLTRSDRVPAATSETLAELGAKKVILIGGETAISPAVADELAAQGLTVERIGGATRYETSANVAMRFEPGVETVYLASGEGYADAVTGTALAGSQNTPVLLTDPDELRPETAAALEALQPQRVVVLGGPAAVSDAVHQAAGASERLAGSDRYETSVKISEAFGERDLSSFASGLDFPDALAGAALASRNDGPVLLTRPDRVPAPVAEHVAANQTSENYLFGGTTAVSEQVENELRALLGL